MRRTFFRLTLGIVTGFLAAACSTQVPGKPTAPPATSITDHAGPSSPNGRPKAPRVANPLDAKKYVANPCASLTSAQLQSFRARGPGVGGDSQGNPGCEWQFGSSGDIAAGVSYGTKTSDGLSNIYGLHDANVYPNGYFEPTEVDGYPAIYTDATDQRTAGKCGLAVGVTDSLFFIVRFDARSGKNSCTAAKNVASAVLDTIKKGA